MIDSHHDATLAIAPEPQREIWIRHYAAIVLGLATLFEVFALPRAIRLGFTVVDAAIVLLCAGLAGLLVARARPAILAFYALLGFGVAEVFSWISVGFAGPSALIPCVLPLLASLFVGGRAPQRVLVGSLAACVTVGALRVKTGWLPPLDVRRLDPQLPANWGNLALALAAVVAPVVWLVSRLVEELNRSFAAVATARSAHATEVRLRAAAEAALEKAAHRAQEARRAEASGLLVAGVVHDLRNQLSVLLLSAHGAIAHPDAGSDEQDAVARIRALCGEAGKVVGDLLRAARPRLAQACSRCFIAEETSAVASVLGGSLPSDFRIACESALAEDREAGVDPHTFACTVLGVMAAAGVASARDRSLRIVAREPTPLEHGMVRDCAAVVELSLGSDSVLPSEAAAELLTRSGGCMLLSPVGSADPIRLLLPPVRPAPMTDDDDG
jgi:signal transduction histidine kinase